MQWLALRCSTAAPPADPGANTAAAALGVAPDAALSTAQQALGWLALRFSPRVARLEEAIVLEVQASLRLFGGLKALHRRLQHEAGAAGLALADMAWAPTALAALALARAGSSTTAHQLRQPLAQRLDALLLATLTATQPHQAMLARLGCRTLGELRGLPRAALARRFGPALLAALDQAYGDKPEAHRWLTLPERFDARLELPWRVEHAPVLSQFADPLLLQLCTWLSARHAGIRQLRLAWAHDAMCARDAGSGGQLELATADTTRDFRHLSRLLAEHLARQSLAAPAGELRLSADTVLPLNEPTEHLLPGTLPQQQATLHQLLERLSVRLGREQVRHGRLREDHRLEAMQAWLPWQADAPTGPRPAPLRPPPGPQPTWLLEPPQPLAQTPLQQPLCQGPLQLVAGPHRIEGGWWDGRLQQRDYFLARSATRGLLWIYRERLPAGQAGWFLHGVFA